MISTTTTISYPQPINDNDVSFAVHAKNATHEIALPRIVMNESSSLRIHRLHSFRFASGVSRTYSDIEWLRAQLIRETPCAIVPRVPSRSLAHLISGDLVRSVSASSKIDGDCAVENDQMAMDIAMWFVLVLDNAYVAQSATLQAFLSTKPMAQVKAEAALAVDEREKQLMRTDQWRLSLFKLWRELRLGVASQSHTLDDSIEAAVRQHKAVSAHMLANAKCLLASASMAAQREVQLGESERKLAQLAGEMVAVNEGESAATATVHDAALQFAAKELASSEAHRVRGTHNERVVRSLVLWQCVAQGYADAAERLALSRDTTHFLASLVSKVEAAANTKSSSPNDRAVALQSRLQSEQNMATAVALGLNDSATALQQLRNKLVAVQVFEQWQ